MLAETSSEMDGGDLYDEFGNYIGPELQDSDESEEEREVESAKDDEVIGTIKKIVCNLYHSRRRKKKRAWRLV